MPVDHGFPPGVFGGIIGGTVVWIVGTYSASKRRWSAEKDLKQVKEWTEFQTPYTAEHLLPWLLQYATATRLLVEESGVAPDRIVLGEKGNGSHYGFFYPILLVPLPGGGTTLRVGALSRFGMLSSAVARQRKRFATRLQQALTMPGGGVGAGGPALQQNPWVGGV